MATRILLSRTSLKNFNRFLQPPLHDSSSSQFLRSSAPSSMVSAPTTISTRIRPWVSINVFRLPLSPAFSVPERLHC
ncbi:hypothetical protein M0R45_025323 [Rubus argutus]|uniref:Uncharacterized protein n=1 Tax=Rubus argutus TaxID=59490 RepID=A0AAW1WU85_RUBAR